TTNFLSTLITEAAASPTPVTVAEMLTRSEKLAVSDPGASNESRATVLALVASNRLTLGDASKAEELYRDAFALLRNSSDRDLRARIACSRALVMEQMGRHAEATHEFDVQLADPTLSAMTSVSCLSNRSEVSRKGGDPPGALRYAQLALQQIRAAGSARAID